MTTSEPRPVRKLLRWTKRLCGLATLALAVAVPVTYFGAPALAKHQWTRHKVEKALARSLGTPVRIEEMAWSWKKGLTLKGVSSREDASMLGTSFAVESVVVKPDASKLLKGKLRARVILVGPEVVVRDVDPEAPALRLPKLRMKIRDLEVRNGTYVWESLHYDQSARIDQIYVRASGELKGRTIRLTSPELSGRFDGTIVYGKGSLSLARDGFTGEIETTDAAGDELIKALRPARVTVKSTAPLSEPF